MRGGIYAIDVTELLVGDAKTFEDTGTITVPKRHKDGTVTYETNMGYKLIILLNLAARHAVQLAAVRPRLHCLADLHLGRGGTFGRAAPRARTDWNTAVAGGASRPNHA